MSSVDGDSGSETSGSSNGVGSQRSHLEANSSVPAPQNVHELLGPGGAGNHSPAKPTSTPRIQLKTGADSSAMKSAASARSFLSSGRKDENNLRAPDRDVLATWKAAKGEPPDALEFANSFSPTPSAYKHLPAERDKDLDNPEVRRRPWAAPFEDDPADMRNKLPPEYSQGVYDDKIVWQDEASQVPFFRASKTIGRPDPQRRPDWEKVARTDIIKMRANEIQSSTLYQDQESRRRPFGFLAGTDYAAHFDGSTDKQRFETLTEEYNRRMQERKDMAHEDRRSHAQWEFVAELEKLKSEKALKAKLAKERALLIEKRQKAQKAKVEAAKAAKAGLAPSYESSTASVPTLHARHGLQAKDRQRATRKASQPAGDDAAPGYAHYKYHDKGDLPHAIQVKQRVKVSHEPRVPPATVRPHGGLAAKQRAEAEADGVFDLAKVTAQLSPKSPVVHRPAPADSMEPSVFNSRAVEEAALDSARTPMAASLTARSRSMHHIPTPANLDRSIDHSGSVASLPDIKTNISGPFQADSPAIGTDSYLLPTKSAPRTGTANSSRSIPSNIAALPVIPTAGRAAPQVNSWVRKRPNEVSSLMPAPPPSFDQTVSAKYRYMASLKMLEEFGQEYTRIGAPPDRTTAYERDYEFYGTDGGRNIGLPPAVVQRPGGPVNLADLADGLSMDELTALTEANDNGTIDGLFAGKRPKYRRNSDGKIERIRPDTPPVVQDECERKQSNPDDDFELPPTAEAYSTHLDPDANGKQVDSDLDSNSSVDSAAVATAAGDILSMKALKDRARQKRTKHKQQQDELHAAIGAVDSSDEEAVQPRKPRRSGRRPGSKSRDKSAGRKASSTKRGKGKTKRKKGKRGGSRSRSRSRAGSVGSRGSRRSRGSSRSSKGKRGKAKRKSKKASSSSKPVRGLYEQRKWDSATRLQRFFRGYVVRRNMAQLQAAASLIQLWWRNLKLKWALRNTVVQAQKFVRGALARLQMRKSKAAALKTQSLFRGMLGRARGRAHMQRRRDACATKIQKTWRAYMYGHLRLNDALRVVRKDRQDRKHGAAGLQRLWKGYNERRKLAWHRYYASVIQDWWRKMQQRLAHWRNLSAEELAVLMARRGVSLAMMKCMEKPEADMAARKLQRFALLIIAQRKRRKLLELARMREDQRLAAETAYCDQAVAVTEQHMQAVLAKGDRLPQVRAEATRLRNSSNEKAQFDKSGARVTMQHLKQGPTAAARREGTALFKLDDVPMTDAIQQCIEMLHDTFELFDSEDNGYLRHEDFELMFQQLCIQVSSRDIAELMITLDPSGAGRVSQGVFVDFIRSFKGEGGDDSESDDGDDATQMDAYKSRNPRITRMRAMLRNRRSASELFQLNRVYAALAKRNLMNQAKAEARRVAKEQFRERYPPATWLRRGEALAVRR